MWAVYAWTAVETQRECVTVDYQWKIIYSQTGRLIRRAAVTYIAVK